MKANTMVLGLMFFLSFFMRELQASCIQVTLKGSLAQELHTAFPHLANIVCSYKGPGAGALCHDCDARNLHRQCQTCAEIPPTRIQCLMDNQNLDARKTDLLFRIFDTKKFPVYDQAMGGYFSYGIREGKCQKRTGGVECLVCSY